MIAHLTGMVEVAVVSNVNCCVQESMMSTKQGHLLHLDLVAPAIRSDIIHISQNTSVSYWQYIHVVPRLLMQNFVALKGRNLNSVVCLISYLDQQVFVVQ